ncbi:Midasin, partial [Stegodyphus mimosarum]
DLFKFCNRITEGFDVTSVETSISVFRNAVECFCDHIPCPKAQLSTAESVGVKFNIPRAKAEYFCKKSKPEIERSADHVKIG